MNVDKALDLIHDQYHALELGLNDEITRSTLTAILSKKIRPLLQVNVVCDERNNSVEVVEANQLALHVQFEHHDVLYAWSSSVCGHRPCARLVGKRRQADA